MVGESGSKSELTAYVLEGTLQVNTAGSKELLEEGDCIVLNTDQAVVWGAAANSRCRILSVSVK